MKIYPAIKARMGRWDYFLVRMSMRELAGQIKYAEEIHGPTQLSDAIQRRLDRSRVKKQIASYLVHQQDRFFSCIVVAALGGAPHWHPVVIENDPKFALLKDNKRLLDSFGVLTFDGSEDYYALDGQHRLAGIRSLIDGDGELVPASGFHDEEMGVLIVTPRQMEESDEFKIRYRRLFGHLNRYAKAMSQFDNIVMDEDDPFAIITRRLVTEHEFFQAVGDEFESARVKMTSGKNVRPGSSHFTSLEMLYEVNIQLLSTRTRRNDGWGDVKRRIREYKRFRPPEDEIDDLYDELFDCWEALISTLPVLRVDPSRMRVHNSQHDATENGDQDCVLFWPIVQELVGRITRRLLDDAESRVPAHESESGLELSAMRDALAPLRSIVWEAHLPPWRHILLVKHVDEEKEVEQWRIASEGRAHRVRLMERILEWQTGLVPLSDEDIYGAAGLQELWRQFIPATATADLDELWAAIEENVRR